VAATAAGLADPLGLIDAQRAAMEEPAHLDAGLLLEGIALRLQADLRWLEACERNWTERRKAR
jgi:hypothetical protein